MLENSAIDIELKYIRTEKLRRKIQSLGEIKQDV